MQQTKRMRKRVPKGTSEYQAAWILDSDEEWESDEQSEEEDMQEDFEPREEEMSQVRRFVACGAYFASRVGMARHLF